MWKAYFACVIFGGAVVGAWAGIGAEQIVLFTAVGAGIGGLAGVALAAIAASFTTLHDQ